jgi:hypothetical protein
MRAASENLATARRPITEYYRSLRGEGTLDEAIHPHLPGSRWSPWALCQRKDQ